MGNCPRCNVALQMGKVETIGLFHDHTLFTCVFYCPECGYVHDGDSEVEFCAAKPMVAYHFDGNVPDQPNKQEEN